MTTTTTARLFSLADAEQALAAAMDRVRRTDVHISTLRTMLQKLCSSTDTTLESPEARALLAAEMELQQRRLRLDGETALWVEIVQMHRSEAAAAAARQGVAA